MAKKKATVKTLKKIGRPSKYTPEIGQKICDLISTSNKGLHTICKKNSDLPAYSTIMKWLYEKTNLEFIDNYTHARESQADYLADEMIEIADRASKDDATKVNRNRLMVDTRKFIASKLKPKKYGDKLDVGLGENVSISVSIKKKDEESKS